ncbi:MAG TPA: beta-ketoacyl-ACP synthase III [Pseudomonadota bacterium]|nr:beta-ketoacyl-ACP synthase III [Pseudomonadota bacterium]
MTEQASSTSLPRRMMILGTGSALPERELTNDDLSKLVDTSDAWIRERTGIAARRVVDKDKGEAASDLAAAAGLRACAAAGISPQEIDCVICATISADMTLPSCAVFVQRKVGAAPHCPAFDLAAACGGFLYGLAVAEGLLRSGQYRRILLCGVEVLSGYVNWQDRNTCILFGDGAGAAVLGLADAAQQQADRGVLSVHLYADGTQAESLSIPGGGSRYPTSAETLAAGQHFIHMAGKVIFTHAVRNLASACLAALKHQGLRPADIDLVVAHQANLRIVEALAQRLELPMDKFFINIGKYGNTSSASVPIALDEAVRAGRVKPGDRLLFCALGAGLAWGSACVRW